MALSKFILVCILNGKAKCVYVGHNIFSAQGLHIPITLMNILLVHLYPLYPVEFIIKPHLFVCVLSSFIPHLLLLQPIFIMHENVMCCLCILFSNIIYSEAQQCLFFDFVYMCFYDGLFLLRFHFLSEYNTVFALQRKNFTAVPGYSLNCTTRKCVLVFVNNTKFRNDFSAVFTCV